MAPDSSPERFLTSEEACKLIEHFSPEVSISPDKIRRWCRTGKLAGERVGKRWVVTLHALFDADLLPLEALDAYGEVLDIPDNVPEEWSSPLQPDEPGPLERMFQQDVEAQAAADSRHPTPAHPHEASDDSKPDATADADDVEVDAWTPRETAQDRPQSDRDALHDVEEDEDDADLAPHRPVDHSTTPSRPARRRPPAPAAKRRRRMAAAGVLLTLALVVGIIAVATSGDRPSPARAQSADDVENAAATEASRAAIDRRRAATRTIASALDRGDYDAAIAAAEELGDRARANEIRTQAARVLLERIDAAIAGKQLSRARTLLERINTRYRDPLPDESSRRWASVHEIEARAAREKARAMARADKRRAAARAKRAAARRARSAALAPQQATSPAPSSSATSSSPSTSSPAPSQSSPAPSSGGGGSSSSGGSSSAKPKSNSEFDYLGGG